MKVSYRQFVKDTLLLVSDRIDSICRTVDPLIPPKHLYSRYGNGNFEAIGLADLQMLLDNCDLRRDARILEIGSGIGRNAVPLTAYLTSEGGYDGFDIVKPGIDYCTAQITPRFPNFRFRWIDLQNRFYNDGGVASATEFTFPYADSSFDVVCSFSVYTHLQPEVVRRYLRESVRVLKPGGRVLNTFFLLNDESLNQIKSGASEIKLRDEINGCLVARKEVPEEAVAIPEQQVRSLHDEVGLSLLKIKYGSWCGRPKFDKGGHDIVVAEIH